MVKKKKKINREFLDTLTEEIKEKFDLEVDAGDCQNTLAVGLPRSISKGTHMAILRHLKGKGIKLTGEEFNPKNGRIYAIGTI